MKISEILSKLTKKQIKKATEDLLDSYMTPAFGALPKLEVELILLQALIDIEYIKEPLYIYDLVTKLKVTRTKARNLIYERELRVFSTEKLDGEIKKFLLKPTFNKDGTYFYLEIENPLVIDHLRKLDSISKCNTLYLF